MVKNRTQFVHNFFVQLKWFDMGKFDGILICSDVDSTLTYEAGKVSDENAKAIKYFHAP